MTLEAPSYRQQPLAFSRQADAPSFAVTGFLVWLRLWFASVCSRGSSDRSQTCQRPPSLLPDSARAAQAPCIRVNRRTRRILARGIPASRGYAALHHLNDRSLTLGQFKERACKLSLSNRIVIYRLSSRKRLCQCREAVSVIGRWKGQDETLSLCAAPLRPD